MDGITWASLLTATGAGVAATIVTLFIDVIKSAFPFVQERINGAGLASSSARSCISPPPSPRASLARTCCLATSLPG